MTRSSLQSFYPNLAKVQRDERPCVRYAKGTATATLEAHIQAARRSSCSGPEQDRRSGLRISPLAGRRPAHFQSEVRPVRGRVLGTPRTRSTGGVNLGTAALIAEGAPRSRSTENAATVVGLSFRRGV